MKQSKAKSKKALDTKLLELASLCVRTRDRHCRNCGKDFNLQGHHIIERQWKLGRYAMDNIITLCSGCHFLQKTSTEQFRDVVIDVIGQKTFDDLKAKYHGKLWKYSTSDLEAMIVEMKATLKSLEEDYGKL